MSDKQSYSHVEESGVSRQLTKKVAEGGGIVLAGSIVGKAANLMLQIILGRVLKAKNYGLYSLGFTISTFGVLISSLGLPNGIVRFGSIYKSEGDKARIKGLLIAALAISLIFSAFAGVSLAMLAGFIADRIFHEPSLTRVIRIFSIAVPFNILIIMIASVARSFHLMKYDAGLRSVAIPALRVFLVISAFLLGFRLNGVIYCSLASIVLSALLGIYVLWKIFPDIRTPLKPIYETKELLRFSFPLLIVELAILFLFRIDRLMLGWLGSSSDVGIYNAAAAMGTQAATISGAFCASVSPVISDLHNKGKKEELRNLFRSTTRLLVILSLPITLLTILFSGNIMAIFGPRFVEGKLTLIFLSIATLVQSVRGPTSPMLVMSGKQYLEMYNTFAAAGLNVILNLWLIRAYGINGAAIATGISIGVISILRLLEVRFVLGLQPYDWRLIKPLLAGLVISLICIFTKMNSGTGLIWIAYAGILMLVYGGILFLLGFEVEELMLIRGVRRKVLSITKG